MTKTNPTPSTSQSQRRSLFWPIMLIGIGALLLLSNLNLLPWSAWNILLRFWPLILVALGVDILIGQRSPIGAVVSAFVLLLILGSAVGAAVFFQQIPFLAESAEPAGWETSSVSHPLDEIHSAEVLIDWSSLPGEITGLDSDLNVIEGEITYRGDLIFDVREQAGRADIILDTRTDSSWIIPIPGPAPRKPWKVALTPSIPLELTLDTGSGSCEFDLSDLNLTDLFLDSGSGSIQLTLPEEGSFPMTVDSGSGSLEIFIPQDSGVRLELDGGSGAFKPSRRFVLISGDDDDGIWETENYQTADDKIDMEVDQGSGSITIQ